MRASKQKWRMDEGRFAAAFEGGKRRICLVHPVKSDVEDSTMSTIDQDNLGAAALTSLLSTDPLYYDCRNVSAHFFQKKGKKNLFRFYLNFRNFPKNACSTSSSTLLLQQPSLLARASLTYLNQRLLLPMRLELVCGIIIFVLMSLNRSHHRSQSFMHQ